jgi:hypothetical protein
MAASYGETTSAELDEPVQIPDLHMTLGKSMSPSQPQFLVYKIEIIVAPPSRKVPLKHFSTVPTTK